MSIPIHRLCIILCALSLASRAIALESNPVTTCAIRWDAWYSNGIDDPARYTAEALSPPRFHPLAPLHATFDSKGAITWSVSAKTFDAEITSAHKAHLCWAYVLYGKNNTIDLSSSMLKGLEYHRRSSIKSEVPYAIITSSSLIGKPGQYQEAATATVDLISDSNYQRVSVRGVSRPLIFLNYGAADLARIFSGSLVKMKEAVDFLRRESTRRDLGNPYIVILSGPASAAEAVRAALDGDAISAYLAGNRKGGIEGWSAFEPTIEAQWDAYDQASPEGAVPTLRSGADIRARCQSPPPFEHRFPAGFNCSQFYVVNPTLSELTLEFRHAHAWLDAHAESGPARLLLVYAWSECDESGNCLMPTIGDPQGAKLSAIASISPASAAGADP
jgi:hypothetical protein